MKRFWFVDAFLPGGAFAQGDIPNKPVRLVVGFAAGGISDVLGRAIAIPLSKQLGQQVIVENKPGAGTTIAGDFIVKSAPDGYTIWLQDITTHAINSTLYPKLPYDSMKDFTFVAMVASTPLMLVVHPSTPANNVRELIAAPQIRAGQVFLRLVGQRHHRAPVGGDAEDRGRRRGAARALQGAATRRRGHPRRRGHVRVLHHAAGDLQREGREAARARGHDAQTRVGGARSPDDGRGRGAQLRDRALLRHARAEGNGPRAWCAS